MANFQVKVKQFTFGEAPRENFRAVLVQVDPQKF
jgi:hypothetical protein